MEKHYTHYRIAGKFGGLADLESHRQIKLRLIAETCTRQKWVWVRVQVSSRSSVKKRARVESTMVRVPLWHRSSELAANCFLRTTAAV